MYKKIEVRKLQSWLILALSFVFLANTVSAKSIVPAETTRVAIIWFVDDSAAGKSDGTSWEDAFPQLQNALDVASNGDEIWVAEGTYYPTKQVDPADVRSANFQLKDGVEIFGGFSETERSWETRDWTKNPTILSGDIDHNDTTSPAANANQIVGNNAYNVIHGDGAGSTTILDGFIVTAGQAIGTGSGHCGIDCGGGLVIYNGSPLLRNLIFLGNSAQFGGGVAIEGYSSPVFENVSFIKNSARDGGGMGVGYDSSPVLASITFYGNYASGYGGAIYCADASKMSFTNGTIVGNKTDGWGGGIFITNSSPMLSHVTLTKNVAPGGSEIIMVYDSHPILRNSIIWGNTSDISIVAGHTSTLAASYSDIRQPDGMIFPGEGNKNSDPQLGDLGDYGGSSLTAPLESGSPAIDAVPVEACVMVDGITPLTLDQRGAIRPQGRACDMGAFEAISYPLFFPVVSK